MNPLLPLALLCLASVPTPGADCTTLKRQVRSIYDFRPSKLDHDGRAAKAKEMDHFWTMVKAAPDTLAPCLREALESPTADAWFRIDGSALLAIVDPTPASKELQVKFWCQANLDDTAPEAWMEMLCTRAAEGFDISEAAKRWLKKPVEFEVAQHALTVNCRYGARFLVGSMDEVQALAVLEPIAANVSSPARDVALDVLACLATPDALRALKRIGLKGCSQKVRDALGPLLAKPGLMPRRTPTAHTTREKLLPAFEAYVAGDSHLLSECIHPEGGEFNQYWAPEFAGALTDEDLPLLRKVRRKRMTILSDEALDDYSAYSGILMTMVWKPEYVQ